MLGKESEEDLLRALNQSIFNMYEENMDDWKLPDSFDNSVYQKSPTKFFDLVDVFSPIDSSCLLTQNISLALDCSLDESTVREKTFLSGIFFYIYQLFQINRSCCL